MPTATAMTGTKPIGLLEIKKTGTEATLHYTDETGAPAEYVVWLQRLNPDEADIVFERANARKAEVFAARDDPDSVLCKAVDAQVDEWDDDLKIDYLVAVRMAERDPVISAQHAYEEGSKWAEDDYLDSLRSAWVGDPDLDVEGLRDAYARDPEDERAKPVFDELAAFTEETSELIQADADRYRAELRQYVPDELHKYVRKELLDHEADRVYAREIHDCQLWLAVRTPDDPNVREFPKRADIDRLDHDLKEQLLAKYREFNEAVLYEGKGSPADPLFSAMFDSAGEPDLSKLSSPTDAND